MFFLWPFSHCDISPATVLLLPPYHVCYDTVMHNETIVFGGGCFWCTEAVFTMLKGVVSAEPGYAGGDAVTANYEQVSRGDTGHVEVVKIVYDPDQLALEELLGVFFATHDPAQVNRQGDDVGPQYASVIFYTTDRQREKAEHYLSVLREKAGVPAVTRVAPLRAFYPAEDYHKNYFASGASPSPSPLASSSSRRR